MTQYPQQQQQGDEEDHWNRPDVNPKKAQHLFHVFEARSARNCKTLSIEMPSPDYKMLCGSCVAVGNTMIIGSYPETSSKWTVIHDPARRSACVILKVIALREENEGEHKFETTIKRLALSNLTTDSTTLTSFFSEFDPATLMNVRGKKVTLHCPIPSKYTLCGGGFYSVIPIISSMPFEGSVNKYSSVGKRELINPGTAWSIECEKNPSIVVFAVGIRTKSSAIFTNNITESVSEAGYMKGEGGSSEPSSLERKSAEKTPKTEALAPASEGPSRNPSPSRNRPVRENIYISLQGPTWEGRFPGNYGNVSFNLGACNFQDPAAAALFVAPNDAEKNVLSKAPPSIWKEIGRPITEEERRTKIGKFCSTSKR